VKRTLAILGLITAGGITAAILFIAWTVLCTRPQTYGLSAADFADEGRDTVAPRDLVQVSDRPLRPNIIVILADDLGYGDPGVYGGTGIGTPHIDRLAREGLRFTQAYASAALCSPSRAGLLTGRYPLRTGITTALQTAGDSVMRKAVYQAGLIFSQVASVDMIGGHSAVLGLPLSEVTLPELLHEAGYRSKAIGKWHLGDFTQWPQYHPFNHGFNEFVGFNVSNDDFPVAFWRGNRQVVADIGTDQQRYTRIFTEEAVKFIEESAGAPFFLYLAHKDPHLPFFPSEPFAGRSDAGPYGDAVTELDWSVGEVIEALERNDLARSTLVIFTSDNGPWFEGSPGGLRGRKGQSYEGGFRVPMIAWWPGTIGAGRITDTPVMNIDFLPTFAALAGVTLPADRVIDGIDIGALLLGAGEAPTEERTLYFFNQYALEGLRHGSWKYYTAISHYTWPLPLDNPVAPLAGVAGARDYQPADGGPPLATLGTWPNLFDLRWDPDESYDVLRRYPEVAGALQTEMDDWRTAFYANPRGWTAHD